jgi:IS30 family transposase
MISPEIRVQIRRYFYAEHWKIGTIAQALNVHPDTVRRAIEVERFQHAEPMRPSIRICRLCAKRWRNIPACAPRAFIR